MAEVKFNYGTKANFEALSRYLRVQLNTPRAASW